MTDLTPQEILDAIERGLERTARRFRDEKTRPRGGWVQPLPPGEESPEPEPHPRQPK